MGASTSSLLRSLSTITRAPSSMALLTLARTASSARFIARPPPATRYRPLTTTARNSGKVPSSSMWMILARSSLSMTGNGSANWRQLSGPGASRFASGPTDELTAVTTSSRMASSGGLVTCANSCWK